VLKETRQNWVIYLVWAFQSSVLLVSHWVLIGRFSQLELSVRAALLNAGIPPDQTSALAGVIINAGSSTSWFIFGVLLTYITLNLQALFQFTTAGKSG